MGQVLFFPSYFTDVELNSAQKGKDWNKIQLEHHENPQAAAAWGVCGDWLVVSELGSWRAQSLLGGNRSAFLGDVREEVAGHKGKFWMA